MILGVTVLVAVGVILGVTVLVTVGVILGVGAGQVWQALVTTAVSFPLIILTWTYWPPYDI